MNSKYYRFEPINPLGPDKKILIQGEFFGQLQPPSAYPSYNDLTGGKVEQEYGLRAGAQLGKSVTASLQVIAQFDTVFNIEQTLIADLIFRLRLTEWLQLAAGTSIWTDLVTSPLGMKQSYSKLIWGMAILF